MKATFGHQTRAPTELIDDNTVTLNILQTPDRMCLQCRVKDSKST